MNEGDEIRVPYPFYLEAYQAMDEDGPHETMSWRPGTQIEDVGPYGDTANFADAMGGMVLTVVSIHKPGRFPERVFYTRKFVDPTGREFGKGGCKIATAQKFKRLCQGYRFPFTVDPGTAATAALAGSGFSASDEDASRS